ncbi:hypothetical protein [Arsenicibacter rosenii]|uniref:Uncharacterized protein n=1 Tax=Arsenicibacter rosenii TaxID=1750698 RepID=A0A1S2VIP9_9BACT|nr:hypothetical protein [Arsenicibacter rosenii]OIN58115.1 hypothetical protein BLX24_16445 [Arsenicibacter rosenii]
MELDEFSALFNARFEESPAQKSLDDITRKIKNRSGTALDRILRNLLLEIGVAFACIIGMSIIAYRIPSITLHWLAGAVWVLSIVQIIAFSWQYRQLKATALPVVVDLRSHLQQQIQVIERFVKIYLAFCLISIPVGFVLGGILGYTIASQNRQDPFLNPIDKLHPGPWGLLIVLIGVIGFLAGIVHFFKFYIRWLYGRHLDLLKSCLTELDQ